MPAGTHMQQPEMIFALTNQNQSLKPKNGVLTFKKQSNFKQQPVFTEGHNAFEKEMDDSSII